MLHLASVGLFIVTPDEVHHCCVVHVAEDVVSTGSSLTVVYHQGEQQRAQDATSTQRGAETQGDQFAQLMRGGECCAKVYKQHPNMSILLQVRQAQVDNRGDGILCRAVGAVSKLEEVE